MFFLLFIFWVVLNGRLTVEIAVFGIVISAFLYIFLCRFTGFGIGKDLRLMRKLPLIVQYCFVLLIEIIKANIVLARYILSPHISAEPALVRFHVDLKTAAAQVLLANSITLTPGTITVDLKEGEYCVHCYDKSMGEGIGESIFVKLLRRLEA